MTGEKGGIVLLFVKRTKIMREVSVYTANKGRHYLH